MSELAFPILGVAAVFLVLVPLATLLSKVVLAVLAAAGQRDPLRGHRWGYALLVVPVLGPLTLAASAGIHQAETGAALAACLAAHLGGACSDAVLFVAALGLPLVGRSLWGVRRQRTQQLASALELRRIRALSTGPLSRLRVRVVRGGSQPIFTRGLLRPEVVVDASLLARLDDGPLRAALLHEAAHARARDPLMYRLATICLSLNPAGGLLRGELERWRLRRESACDDFALARGAAPLDLAEALVAAARPRVPSPLDVCLGAGSLGALQLRVQRLLVFAERGATPTPAPSQTPALFTLLAAAVVLPQWLGSAPLNHFHRGIEHLLVAAGLF